MTAPFDAALEYAARGWPTFPIWSPADCAEQRCRPDRAECSSPGKHPLTPHGLYDATTNLDVIRSWWRRWPNANVGLRTGVRFDVLDVDGPAAGRALAIAAQLAGEDTETCWGWGPMSLTAAGAHLLYEPTGAGNASGLVVPKIDWRGAGGYIVAPPSVHASGHTYAWHHDCPPDAPLPLAPVFLVAALFKLTRTSQRGPRRASADAPASPGALAGMVRHLAAAPEGERNDRLNWASWKLGEKRRRGEIDDATARQVLGELHDTAIDIGLTDREVAATIRSGWTRGVGGASDRAAS